MTATVGAWPARRSAAPARRALVRWAWRMFRREWRQQLLVLALLAVAVAATTAGLGVATAATVAPETKITLPGSDAQLDADIAALRQQFGRLDVVHHRHVPVPGSIENVDVRAPEAAAARNGLRVVSGRFPSGAAEVAMTDRVAAAFDVHVGDEWTQDGTTRRVVGIVENPQNLDDEFALLPPGQADPPETVTVVLSIGDGVNMPRLPSGSPLAIEGRSAVAQSAAAATVLALETIGLLFVGLVSVAGFTVMAQRRQRALGMLESLGATDRHVRLVMLANGALVGAAASIAGGVAGLALWLAFAPTLETLSAHRIDRFDLPWWAIAGALVLAVATSVAAAWWPARSVSKTSVVAALSNRPPRPRPARHFAAVGGVLLAGGLVLLWSARDRRPLFVVTGILGVDVGVLLLAPLAVRVLGAFARRAPVAARLALRDLVRYQGRSAAALGAITLAIAIAATTAVSAAYEVGSGPKSRGNLPDNQLLVRLAPHAGAGPIPDLAPADVAAVRGTIDGIARDVGGADALELDAAVNPNAPQVPGFGPGRTDPAALVHEEPDLEHHGTRINVIATAYVATPAVLQRFGIKAGDVDPTVDVISSRTDLAGLRLASGPRQSIVPKVQHAKLSPYGAGPDTLLTQQAVQRLGLEVVPAAWLLQTTKPLSDAQIAAARKTAAAAGVVVETRTRQDSLTRLGDWMTAAGAFLALGVLALTVGLIRSETANDLRTLAATGASARTRRSITGVTAGALALLGAVLGTAAAYLALAAWHRSDLHPLHNIPAVDLTVILVGLPVAAAVGGWLLAGREPSAIARRPLD